MGMTWDHALLWRVPCRKRSGLDLRRYLQPEPSLEDRRMVGPGAGKADRKLASAELCAGPSESQLGGSRFRGGGGRAGRPKAGVHANAPRDSKQPRGDELLASGRRDSNPGPPAPKAGALPDCATPRTDTTAPLYPALPHCPSELVWKKVCKKRPDHAFLRRSSAPFMTTLNIVASSGCW
jgi:hypothetical protein